MKNLIFALLLLPSAALAGPALKIVQSVPDETVYGSTAAARPGRVWREMINSASVSLDIQQFYIAEKPGEDLTPVLEAIRAARGRDVRVRFIVDTAMMKESSQHIPELVKAGVQVRVMDFKKAGGGVQHSKFFIVDSREVYTGSQNFDWRSIKHIHEIGVRITSPRAAADFKKLFEADWAVAGGADAKKTYAKQVKQQVSAASPEIAALEGGTVTYRLAFSPVGSVPAGMDVEWDELLKFIDGAKRYLKGQVMTYALQEHGSKRWDGLDAALRRAGARGVKVELIFADWAMGGKNDADIKALSAAPGVSVKISSLPRHSSGFVPFSRVEHCKYMTADGERSYVTNSNWGPGYFLTSRGTAVFMDGAPAAAILEEIFDKAWTGPYALPVDRAKSYQPVKRS